MTITVRSRSLIWFVMGAVTAVVATAVWISAWSAEASPGDADATVVPITACRLTDTRPSTKVGPRSTPLAAEETYVVEVQDTSTDCFGKVPSATGLLLNVTAVQTTQPTFLSIWDNGPFPGTSSLNPVPGPAVPNAVTTKLADDDTFRIYNRTGATHVVIDVVGYLTPTSLQELSATVGTPGPKGDPGPRGEAGPVNRISDEQIATLAWYDDPGAAATIPVADGPSSATFDGTNVYVTRLNGDSVSVINPATNTVTATIAVGDGPIGSAFDGDNVYVTNSFADTVSVINPATNTVTATIAVGDGPYGLAFGGSNMYVANRNSGTVSVINRTTKTVTTTIPVGTNPTGVAFDGSSVYVTNQGENSVSVIDATTNSVVTTVPVGIAPYGVAFDGTNIYVTNVGNSVSVIDPATNVATDTIPVGNSPFGIAFDGTHIYVTNLNGASVSVIDRATKTVSTTIPVGGDPSSAVFDGRNLYVTNTAANSVSKLVPH